MSTSPMTELTLLASLVGGLLIGIAAILLMALQGRIAGISGILGSILPPTPAADWQWRVAFLSGMVVSPFVYQIITGSVLQIVVSADTLSLLIGGIIVGLGVTFGSGCTSGHGVCGLARLSPRSMASILTFMGTATATVFLIRHVLGG